MIEHTLAGRLLVALTVVFALLGLGAEPSDADASDVKPVANNDVYTQYYVYQTADLPVLANDYDPLGRPLTICRLESTPDAVFGVLPGGPQVISMLLSDVSGTINLTYGISATGTCDDESSMAFAELTVVVHSAKLKVKFDRPQSGYVTLHNTTKLKGRFAWTTKKHTVASNHVRLKPGQTKKVFIGRHKMAFWAATFKNLGQIVPGNSGRTQLH